MWGLVSLWGPALKHDIAAQWAKDKVYKNIRVELISLKHLPSDGNCLDTDGASFSRASRHVWCVALLIRNRSQSTCIGRTDLKGLELVQKKRMDGHGKQREWKGKVKWGDRYCNLLYTIIRYESLRHSCCLQYLMPLFFIFLFMLPCVILYITQNYKITSSPTTLEYLMI